MRPRRALIPLVAATVLLTSCTSNSDAPGGVDSPAEHADDAERAATATPVPAKTKVAENTLTDEQLLEIQSACFDEVVADPEMINVIAAMPEEWAQSTYDMAENQYCETVVVNVEEWRKMSRFDE